MARQEKRKLFKRATTQFVLKWKRRKRIRKKIAGTEERPRLCVNKSNRAIAAQLINDEVGTTLLALRTDKKTVNCTTAKELGKKFAEMAKTKGVEKVVFDRGGNPYHGRVSSFAEGAREGGLQF